MIIWLVAQVCFWPQRCLKRRVCSDVPAVGVEYFCCNDLWGIWKVWLVVLYNLIWVFCGKSCGHSAERGRSSENLFVLDSSWSKHQSRITPCCWNDSSEGQLNSPTVFCFLFYSYTFFKIFLALKKLFGVKRAVELFNFIIVCLVQCSLILANTFICGKKQY